MLDNETNATQAPTDSPSAQLGLPTNEPSFQFEPVETESISPSYVPTQRPSTETTSPDIIPTQSPVTDTVSPNTERPSIETAVPSLQPFTSEPSATVNNTQNKTFMPTLDLENATEAPTLDFGNATSAPSPAQNNTLMPTLDFANSTLGPSLDIWNATLMPTDSPTEYNVTDGNSTMAPTPDLGEESENKTLSPSTPSPSFATERPTTFDSESTPSPSLATEQPTTLANASTPSPSLLIQPRSVEVDFSDVSIRLTGVGELGDEGISAFETSMEQFYRETFSSQTSRRRLQEDGISTFDTNVTVTDETPSPEGNIITYNQRMTFDSETELSDDEIRDAILISPLASSEGKERLIEILKEDSSQVFSSLVFVGQPSIQEDDDDSSGLSVVWFIVIAVGGLCCCGCLGACVARTYCSRQRNDGKLLENEFPAGDDINFHANEVEVVGEMNELFVDETGVGDSPNFLGPSEHVSQLFDGSKSRSFGKNSRQRGRDYSGSGPPPVEPNDRRTTAEPEVYGLGRHSRQRSTVWQAVDPPEEDDNSDSEDSFGLDSISESRSESDDYSSDSDYGTDDSSTSSAEESSRSSGHSGKSMDDASEWGVSVA